MSPKNSDGMMEKLNGNPIKQTEHRKPAHFVKSLPLFSNIKNHPPHEWFSPFFCIVSAYQSSINPPKPSFPKSFSQSLPKSLS